MDQPGRASAAQDTVDVPELLATCGELAAAARMLDRERAREVLAGRDVLELGCGPCGLGVLSFLPEKAETGTYIKADPLPRQDPRAVVAAGDWAGGFLAWAGELAGEGEFVRLDKERLHIDRNVDAILSYRFLDRMARPAPLLADANRLLRPGGHLLVWLDCASITERLWFLGVGRWRAHAGGGRKARRRAFRQPHVGELLRNTGFSQIRRLGAAAGGRPGPTLFLAAKPLL